MSTHQAKLPWLRFWCPLGSTLLSDGDDAGFLYDPADELGRHVNPCLRTLPELLSEAGPLVLCGEPGLGKSTELEAVRATIKAEHAADGGGTCWLRFQGIVDFADFRKRSIEIGAWQQWRQGQGRFTLVVDGVDEGLLRVANFVSALHDLLEDEPTERLRLILACRTREWPVEAGSELLSLWPGDADTRVYELCPLRRADVRNFS